MIGLQIQVTHGADIATYPPGATFGPRMMREWEFVWLLEGQAHFRFERSGQSQEIELCPGQLLLCRPGQREFFTWDPRKRTRHGFFHFELTECDDRWPPPATWPLVRTFDETELVAPLTRHLVQIYASAPTPQSAGQRDLAATLLLATFLTGAASSSEPAAEPVPDVVERALHWMTTTLDNDPATPISLADLAQAAFVSPEHLCRLFQATTGHSPLQTVRLARLDRAALLLARSNYSVAEITRLCGFASQFHFSRVFKAAYGLAPQTLRIALRNGEPMPASRLVRTWTSRTTPK